MQDTTEGGTINSGPYGMWTLPVYMYFCRLMVLTTQRKSRHTW